MQILSLTAPFIWQIVARNICHTKRFSDSREKRDASREKQDASREKRDER